jgi:sulfonate transport system ATP-binding protein
MQDLLLEIHAAEPTTILLVTHDVEEALYLADRVVLLGATDGRDASIRAEITVPGTRPRDRAWAELAALRAELLDGLGVATHCSPNPATGGHATGRTNGTTLTPESHR